MFWGSKLRVFRLNFCVNLEVSSQQTTWQVEAFHEAYVSQRRRNCDSERYRKTQPCGSNIFRERLCDWAEGIVCTMSLATAMIGVLPNDDHLDLSQGRVRPRVDIFG